MKHLAIESNRAVRMLIFGAKQRQHTYAALVASLLFLCFPHAANAQWLTQNITVTNGWTAAYLFVDASSQPILPTTPGAPISSAPSIDQIWLWQVPAGSAQYISTPQSPLNSGGRWISWAQTNTQNSLTALIPNAAYLIHSTGQGSFNWAVQGQPVPPQYSWDLTGLNFIGFSTPSVNPPNFQGYLAPDPGIANIVTIYQYVGGPFSSQTPLNPAPVTSFSTTMVNRGQAYWVGASNVNNTYFGPFQVNLPDPAGISYGASAGQLTFHLVNITASPLTISMSLLPSETPPAGQTPIAGAPPLLLEGALNNSNLTYAYTAINPGSAPSSWTLPPFGQQGSDVAVVLGVNRFSMSGTVGSLYAGVLQFTDSLGFSQLNVPVSATVADDTGLWVGKASVTGVSYDLKTYASSNNAYVSSMITNYTTNLVTNGPAALGQATNLLVTYAINNALVTNYYSFTTNVISSFTSNSTYFTTNSYVISTSYGVAVGVLSNVVIQTIATNSYTNANHVKIWETSNTTNITVITNGGGYTNSFFTLSNQVTVVPNNTLVSVTDYDLDQINLETIVVTNGILTNGAPAKPVTNTLGSFYLATNYFDSTNPAITVVTTNVVPITFSLTTNLPPSGNFSISANAVAESATTNLYPGSFLSVTTNSGAGYNSLIGTSYETNISLVTNNVYLFYTNISVAISNSYEVTLHPSVLGNPPIPPFFTTNLLTTVTKFSTNTPSPFFASSSTNSTNVGLAVATTNWIVTLTNTNVYAGPYVISNINTNLDSVVAPYPLRLIIFNGSNACSGSVGCCLLQRVYYGLDLTGTNAIVTTTQNALGQANWNTARRISATHLPWQGTNTPWCFTGGLLTPGGTYTTTITELYDDQASNPFLHTYHPDHNNLNSSFSPPLELPIGSESYEIDRTINLSVEANGDDFLSLTSANSGLSGIYYETITLKGLGGFSKTYQTAGSFSLQRISTIATLTTQ